MSFKRAIVGALSTVIALAVCAVTPTATAAVTPTAAAKADEVTTITLDGVSMMHQRRLDPGPPDEWSGDSGNADFDGDGLDDFAAAGDTGVQALPQSSSGLVVVRYSNVDYWDYFAGVLTEKGCECFARTLVTGDFNGDGFDDLAIGDVGEVDAGTNVRAGGVWIIPGSGDGLRVDGVQHVNQNSAGMPDVAEKDDLFADGLAIGWVNGDRYADLVVGSPGENRRDERGNGMLTLIWGVRTGLSSTGATAVTGAAASSTGTRLHELGDVVAVADTTGDGLGEVVAGVSGATVDGAGEAGAVVSFRAAPMACRPTASA
jgi:hypothetical protein